MEKRHKIAGLNDYALARCGYRKDEILKAVEGCITAMGELWFGSAGADYMHLLLCAAQRARIVNKEVDQIGKGI